MIAEQQSAKIRIMRPGSDNYDGEHIYGGGSHRAREWNGAFRDGGAFFCFWALVKRLKSM